MISVRGGGSDPGTNSRLRSAIERARSSGLSKENIERAIGRASGQNDGGSLYEFLYEATEPFGLKMLIEGITNNKNRSLAEIKQILNKYGSKLADPGSVLWNFDKIGTIDILKEENAHPPKEEAELMIIESGASDFLALDNVWLVETPLSELENVRKRLEEKGFKINEAAYDYKPKLSIEIPKEAGQSVNSLLDELSDHDDIQEVYTNIK